MKKILLALSTITCFCFSKCEKDINGLPPATQEGRNTLGFLLNGEPWAPKGQVGLSANLAIDLDFGYKNGILGITAYKYISGNREDFGIGLKDSLNFITFPANMPLAKNTISNARFTNSWCNCDFYDTSIYRGGNLYISKLDKTNRIIAGTFNVTLYKAGCPDTIKITEGRFDMKY